MHCRCMECRLFSVSLILRFRRRSVTRFSWAPVLCMYMYFIRPAYTDWWGKTDLEVLGGVRFTEKTGIPKPFSPYFTHILHFKHMTSKYPWNPWVLLLKCLCYPLPHPGVETTHWIFDLRYTLQCANKVGLNQGESDVCMCLFKWGWGCVLLYPAILTFICSTILNNDPSPATPLIRLNPVRA